MMEKKKEAKKRFQECTNLQKIWRYRWYLTIPFVAFYTWFRCQFEDFNDENVDWTDWGLHWSLAISMAQVNMNWYFSYDEVKQQVEEKFLSDKEIENDHGDEDDDDEETFGDHSIY